MRELCVAHVERVSQSGGRQRWRIRGRGCVPIPLRSFANNGFESRTWSAFFLRSALARSSVCFSIFFLSSPAWIVEYCAGAKQRRAG